MIDSETIHNVVSRVISDNAEEVHAWSLGQPGSWGALAGRAVIATRIEVGRKLTEGERRMVWSSLWERLTIMT